MSNLPYVLQCTAIASLGGLLFGYDWVVISGAKPFYEPYFGLSGSEQAWASGFAVSSALVGCLLGALSSGKLAQRWGRRNLLVVAGLVFLSSSLWTAVSGEYWSFVSSRVFGGIGIGIASGISPLYIAEISPARHRGSLVAVYQLAIVVGILLAQIVNLCIYQSSPVPIEYTDAAVGKTWAGQAGWRWMFAAESVPAVLLFGLGFMLPKSPRWLYMNGRKEQAESILNKLVGRDAHATLQEISNIFDQRSSVKIDQRPVHRARLWLGVFLAVFQQWCGINIVFNYADEIFQAANFALGELMFSIVLTGTVNLLFTILAMRWVDRIGRRTLMIGGAMGLFVAFSILGFLFFSQQAGVIFLLLLLVSISIYAATLAPITWVLLSELFPIEHRSQMLSWSVSALWVACFLLTITFKPMSVAMGIASTFWLYSAICLTGAVLMFFVLPETKGKSLEMLEAKLEL
ncbi:sugar porter family MFS transporter [Mariniblastus fucicola]|uniref:D-xylose-proton symporter n=1 Tax=Mariniblastus fucicola TaxID=980251 RepID=A0A5B9PD14_9BACT|nr:sugar porter family MFS transporter [Mariniblastus fucicola]QEG23409.1 D-xylose-proton symporter [Mariniblastus fucicola]